MSEQPEKSTYHITNREWWDDEAVEWWSSLGPDHATLTGHEMREFLGKMIEKAELRGANKMLELVINTTKTIGFRSSSENNENLVKSCETVLEYIKPKLLDAFNSLKPKPKEY